VGAARGGGTIPPVTITAKALAGAAARMVVVSGDRQRGTVGAPLRKPIVVRVLDAAGNGVADAALVAAVGSGTLPDSLVRTDASGRLHSTGPSAARRAVTRSACTSTG